MVTIPLNRFDGGISDDSRANVSNKFVLSKHFDIFSYPNRLVPYRSTEADTNDGSTSTGMKQYDVRNFQLGADGKLYGLGIQPASPTRSKIVSKADPTTGNWTLNATAESGVNGSASFRNSFMEWGTTPVFLGFGGTTDIWKWVIGGTWTDVVATVGATITHVAQSVKAKDNNLYMFYNNKVVRVTPGLTVTDAVLTLPADGRITSACNYGNFLAIAWASGTTLTAGGRSKLFIWDLVSSDVTESVDMGEGQLMVVGNIEGKVVGVSDLNMSSLFGIGAGSVVIRLYAGGEPQIIKELRATQTVTLGLFIRDVVVKANKMYFAAAIPFNSSTSAQSTFNLGIYAFGRKDVNSPFAFTLDFIEEAVDTSNYKIVSFGNAGNYWFINHSADGSITKTDDAANYTFTSVYETQKFSDGDPSNPKQLFGVAVTTAPMPTAGQVVVKYRKDEETSYTTILTNTTDNSLSKDAVNIESTGANLPEFKEIQFRIESTGGAEVTGFKFVYDVQTDVLG